MRLGADIVRDAGGRIIGRTRLQKSVFLLSLAGFEKRFQFGYKHYGPFSESLAEAVDLAVAFDLISERRGESSWGGTYSDYSVKDSTDVDADARVRLLREAAKSDPILLELAATAGYLFQEEGSNEPWAKTARLKPDKSADGRLERAKNLYLHLRAVSDNALPEIGSA
ncbi:MAG: hypothetical protein ACLPSW_04545 [Roseiarcus sp.]